MAKLSGANLVDLIQMECLRGNRQVVRVGCASTRGYLFFDGGQLVHAICGHQVGEAAVFEMLRWQDGTFEPCEASWPAQRSITVGWQFLLIEAMRRGDEADRDSDPASQEIELHPAPMAQARPARVGPNQAGPNQAGPNQAGPNQAGQLSDSQEGISHEEPKVPVMASSNESEASRYGVVRAVRFEEDGQVISHLGQYGDLADISSYALRLARILGETLGIGEFIGLESRVDDKSLFLFLDEETVVAVEAHSDANVTSYRKKAGF